MRDFDKQEVVRRTQRAMKNEGHHPSARCYRFDGGKKSLHYRVGPGRQFVKVSFGKIWATITGEKKVQRVRIA